MLQQLPCHAMLCHACIYHVAQAARCKHPQPRETTRQPYASYTLLGGEKGKQLVNASCVCCNLLAQLAAIWHSN